MKENEKGVLYYQTIGSFVSLKINTWQLHVIIVKKSPYIYPYVLENESLSMKNKYIIIYLLKSFLYKTQAPLKRTLKRDRERYALAWFI